MGHQAWVPILRGCQKSMTHLTCPGVFAGAGEALLCSAIGAGQHNPTPSNILGGRWGKWYGISHCQSLYSPRHVMYLPSWGGEGFQIGHQVWLPWGLHCGTADAAIAAGAFSVQRTCPHSIPFHRCSMSLLCLCI